MAAEKLLLQCGDCRTLLKSVEEAEQHVKHISHTNFCESTEPIRHLVCTACGKPCLCKTEFDFHAKRTGHTKFQDKTAEVAEEEERRAREKLLQQFEEIIKAETRKLLGLPPRNPALAKLLRPLLEEEKSSLPVSPATTAEQMSECLGTIKLNHMDDEAKVKNSFNTLLTYAKNVATNPDEEKYRKIRLSNAAFQERVGKLRGGIEFLELCGFEKIEGGEFLYLPREKVDMDVLYSAGHELNSAIKNPFF
ncbi:uncharacterized protein LOC107772290 [Nicotiana tabacum]|uniref:Uncharacterized protein LOC107772290 n=1 Tax=Nicotiana tabacum TaxID=4097 RepID=A0A1S3Y515_TOBAC|nr:PREDICTED: uncharacterized protein LOC107772290 [Nicotiana tabacum]